MSQDAALSYDAFILDCDGVILDSNQLKMDAFRRTLEAHGFAPEVVSAGAAWQATAFGTSRYRLFDVMLSGRFGPAPSVGLDELLATYGVACAAGYLEVPETPRLRSALASLAARAPLYVASGSDEAELRQVFRARTLEPFFAEIFGSPTRKAENIERVREAHKVRTGRPPARMLFVGDAVADVDAAQATGCDFAFMEPYSTVRSAMLSRAAAEGFQVISDLGQLADRLVLSDRHD